MRPRIFITQPVAPSAIARLRNIGDVRMNPDPLHIMTKGELIATVREADFLYCMLHDRIDRDVLEANPKLKAVVSTTITPADIDTETATRLGIPVTALPPVMLDDATADLAWALMFAVARRVAEADRVVRGGTIPGSQSCYLEGSAVSGKVLGLIGMGGVGRAAAERARGFRMPLLYTDPRRLPPADEQALGLTAVPLDELLARSDFVSLHARLTPETRHMIGAREFALMKPTAYLINTARGPLVDEQALVAALRDKRIAGAGLDVYEHEPDIPHELINNPHVVVLPHMGSAVRELREAMAHLVVDNIEAVLAGKPAPNCWNTAVYGKPQRS
jgi:glyoxylate reductase